MITLTAFKKLTSTQITKQLPLEISNYGKLLFNAVSKVSDSSLTKDQLIQLVLKARNENSGDSAHVANATKIVDTFLGTVSPTPTPPSPDPTPTPPPTPSALTLSRPYWLGGWSGNVEDAIKNTANNDTSDILLFVLYNIPNRDDGSYSAGGLANDTEYLSWIDSVVRGVGTKKVILILEPDALGHAMGWTDTGKRDDRIKLINSTLAKLDSLSNATVLYDVSMWGGREQSNIELIKNLVKGGDGGSLNVSGFESQGKCDAYAQMLFEATGKKFLIDTSRNGNGNPHPGKWCNVTDTKIGLSPTFNTNKVGVYAYAWVKVPGESDGNCINGDGSQSRADVPSAGQLFPDYREAIYSGNWTAFKQKYNV